MIIIIMHYSYIASVRAMCAKYSYCNDSDIGSCKLKPLFYVWASKSLPVDRRLLGSFFVFVKEATKQSYENMIIFIPCKCLITV